MAARPFLAAMTKAIEKMGGEEAIFDRLASGETVGSIADSIYIPEFKRSPSRSYMYMWRRRGGDERVRKWKEAIVHSADALAEEAGTVLDELVGRAATAADVSLAKSRSEHRRWLATKYNKEKYGDAKAQVEVHLSLGDLHLSALRARGHMDNVPKELPEGIEEADFEVLEEEEIHAEVV